MIKKIPNTSGLIIAGVLLLSALYCEAQTAGTKQGKGELAENLWSTYEPSWENTMLNYLNTDKEGFEELLNFEKADFFEDRSQFVSLARFGLITNDNAENFFDNLENKYAALYKEFQQIQSVDSFNGQVSARYKSNPSIQSACNPACSNINFQNNTLSSWYAYYGVAASTSGAINITGLTGGACGSVTQAAGPDAGTGNTYQATLLTNPGTDPIAGALIPYAPPLGGKCTMVGDGPNPGWGVGDLQQTFTVDPSNPILTLQYAVVLENPAGHPGYEQPWFQIQVLDQNGAPIPGCGQYFEKAGAGLPGYTGFYYAGEGDTVYCKPWTTVFVPLYNYIGQCVTVDFEASDCALGGHFGYAYVTASCEKFELQSSSNVFCNGQTSATITGPAGAASYQWTTSNGCISGLSTNQIVNVTCAGTYNLVTTTSGGASCADTFSIVLPSSPAGPPPVPCFTSNVVCSGTPTVFDATCSNPNNGATYYWDFYNSGQYEDSSGTSPSFTYSSGGFYKVKLHEVAANGCASDTVITIAVDSSYNGTSSFPAFSSTVTNTSSCSACNGGINIMGRGGNTNVTITTSFDSTRITMGGGSISIKCGSGNCKSCGLIINGTGITEKFCNLCQGTYYFYIKPTVVVPPSICSPGGFPGDTIAITVNDSGVSIVPTITTTTATCGNNNGSATVTASGGTSPYIYSWPGGLGTGSSKSNLAPGTYTVAITDSAGCIGSANVNILSSGQQSAVITPYYVTCFGANNGSIKVTPTGGVAPYTYSWTGNVSTTDSAGGLSPGSYSVSVTDSGGCSGTFTATINQPDQLHDSIVSSVTNIGCGGGGKGSAALGVTGGSPPYRFVWSDGNQSATDTALVAGTTTVNIIDANGCNIVDSVVVVATGGFAVNAGPDLNICLNDSSQINVTGIPGGSIISWLPAAGLSCTNCANPFAKPVIPTTYIVTVSNGGCSSSDTVKVNVTAAVIARVSPADTAICANDFFQLSASGGSGYQWSPASGLSNDTIADPIVYTTVTTTYTVTVSNPGCSGVTATATVNVNAAPPVPLITQVHGDTLLCGYDTSYSSYQWYDSTVLINGATKSFLVINHSGNYNIHVTGKDGCSIAVGINVIVNPNGLQDFSSSAIIVSPNPANEKFNIRGLASYKRLMVFDVLGKLVRSELTTGDEMMINVADLSQGIYFLQVVNDNNRWTCKFIKE